MQRLSKMLTVVICLTLIAVSLSGCLDRDQENDDNNDDQIPAYIHHTENANISLSIVRVYSTDHLTGVDNDGNDFTIYAKDHYVFTVILLNVTNARARDPIQTEERHFSVLDNRGLERSMTQDIFIDDPQGDEFYRIHHFDFTNETNYMVDYEIQPYQTVKLAAVGMAPPNSIRTVVLGFKILEHMAEFQPYQRVSIDVPVD